MQVFSTTQSDLSAISSDLKASLPTSPTFILYFHSSSYDGAAVGALLASLYPGVPMLGCSTAGEIATGMMLDGGLVVAGYTADEIAQAVVVPIQGDNVKQAYLDLESRMGNVDFETHVGLILMDGLSGKEEALMDTLGVCTDLTFVGGSAGDDLKFVKTSVAANGQVGNGFGAMAMLHVPAGFDLIKTQSFRTTGVTLTPTRVEIGTRAVLEFNGIPAARAYAEAVGAASVADAPNMFMSNPLGLMADEEPFVRSPQRIEGDNMYFYCSVSEGMELELLQGQNIVADTEEALAMFKFRSLIVFNCILRTLDLKNQGKTGEFGKLFVQPTIGLSTYGEAFLGHINQTATILALR